MGQFDPLADGREMDGVIAHHVAAAQGVHADDALGSRADVAVAAMEGQVFVAAARRLRPGFRRGAAPFRWGRRA